MDIAIPEGFAPLALRASGFLDANGPFFGRRDGDVLTIGLRIEPRHCNSAGFAHGGMLMTLVDVVLTVGSNFNAGTSRFLPTLSATCDFIRPARSGSWVQGTADILEVSAQHVFSKLLLTDDSGAVLMRASGILAIRGEPDPRFHRDALGWAT